MAAYGTWRRWTIAVGLAAVSSSLTVACGNAGGASGGSDQTLTVKFATASAPDSLGAEGASYFAAEVSKATGGKIKVKVYPNAELGATSTVNQALVSGSIQFTSDDVLDSYVPEVDLLSTAYLFPSEAVANKALNSHDMYNLMWNRFEDKGLRILGVWPSGFSSLYTTRPVRTVKDLSGLKVRTFDPVVEQPEFSAVGASAVTVEYNQVYTSLSTNLIQGVTDPPSLVVPLKWQEPAHYVAELNLAYITTPLLVSETFWKSLNTKQQQEVERAAASTLTYEQQRCDYWNAQASAALKANPKVTISSPDVASFEAAFRKAYSSIDSKFPGELAKIRAVVAKSQSGS